MQHRVTRCRAPSHSIMWETQLVKDESLHWHLEVIWDLRSSDGVPKRLEVLRWSAKEHHHAPSGFTTMRQVVSWHLRGSFHDTFMAPSMAPLRLLLWHLQGSFHGTFMAPSMAPSWHLTHPKVPLRLHHPLPRLSKLTHFTYIGP
jgi:hypothetical protein